MASLGSHYNVYETCLHLLQKRGWQLSVALDLDGDQEQWGMWTALREVDGESIDLCADNPIELLGLVNVWEIHWPANNEPWWWRRDIKGNFLLKQIEDEARLALQRRIEQFEMSRDAHPSIWEANIREAIQEYGDLCNAAAVLEIPQSILMKALDRPEFSDLQDTPLHP